MFKTFDRDVKEGDFVVIPTDTRHNMTVCKVKQVDMEVDFDSGAEMKWLVGRISVADVQDIQKQEADAITVIKAAEKNRKKTELRDSLLAAVGQGLKALPIYSAQAETTKG